MRHTLTFVLAGGDARQVYLGERLLSAGHRVQTVGLERQESTLPVSTDYRSLFAEADAILLPMPVMGNRGRLNAPLANAPYKLTEVLDAIPAGKPVFGGAVPKMVHEMAARRKLAVKDYLQREELAVRNAVPTAEGAIRIALEELPVTLHGLPILIIGAGRIGCALAVRLKGLCAEVTVSARSVSDFAKLESMGLRQLDTRKLTGELDRFPLIFNTVPHPVLTRALLTECPPETLVIDLASGAGGIAEDARELCRVIHAQSLPGKTAPKSAAGAIFTTVCHMLEEEGLL